MQAMKHDLDAQIAAEERKQGYLESIGKLKDEVAKMQQHIDTMKDIKQLRAKIKGVNITVPAPVVPGAPDAPVQETTTMKSGCAGHRVSRRLGVCRGRVGEC